jgi:uncharacterized lipoprotein YmbA
MNIRHKSAIYGERIEDLLPGLLAVRDAMTVDAAGMYRGSFKLEPKNGVPLRRALMRVEAELLSDDADLVGCRRFQVRNYEQRAADALVRLVQAIGESAPD